MAAKGKLIFAAVGEDVVIWKRADIVRVGVGGQDIMIMYHCYYRSTRRVCGGLIQIGRLRGSDTNGGKVSSLLVFGDLLLTLSAGTRTLSVWFIKVTYEKNGCQT